MFWVWGGDMGSEVGVGVGGGLWTVCLRIVPGQQVCCLEPDSKARL